MGRLEKANLTLDSYELEIEDLKALTGVEHTPNLLEIGSGGGMFLLSAVALGFADAGIGLDPGNESDGTSADDIKRSQQVVLDLDLVGKVRFEQSTLRELLDGASAERYSMIVFRNSLHHIFERDADRSIDQSVAEQCVQDLISLQRFLTDDGVLYILEATRAPFLVAKLSDVYRRSKGLGPIGWADKRTKPEWIDLLRAAGFRNTVSANRPYNKWIGNPIVRNAGKRMSAQFAVAARR